MAVIGATAIAIPHQPGAVGRATVVVRAIDAEACRTLWTYRLAAPTYASVSVAGNVVFVLDTFGFSLIALDAATGVPHATRPIFGAPSSTATISGASLFVAAGTDAGLPTLNKSGAVYRFVLPSLA